MAYIVTCSDTDTSRVKQFGVHADRIILSTESEALAFVQQCEDMWPAHSSMLGSYDINEEDAEVTFIFCDGRLIEIESA